VVAALDFHSQDIRLDAAAVQGVAATAGLRIDGR
jgi:hypothetical protein